LSLRKIYWLIERRLKTMNSDPNPSSSSANSSPKWELAKILLPTVFTTLIGFGIWNEQTKIQTAVDINNQYLRTQLALGEEYYKRRLTIYADACRQIAETKSALDQAGTTPEFETHAITTMAELDKLRKVNTLYWSSNLEKQLGKLWRLGIDKLRDRKFDDNQLEDKITSEIAELHDQMRQDLQLSEIGRALTGQDNRHQ
jgi:hypothetical protein